MSTHGGAPEAPKGRARLEPPDLGERGGLKNGAPQRSDERLFMQLLAFGGCRDIRAVTEAFAESRLTGVIYEDLNDPRGIAVLALSEDPNQFIDSLRPMLGRAPFDSLELKPNYTMFGRTYSIGYEPDLRETLIDRPRRTVLNPDWRWATWYPLRRSGRFSQLSPEEQRTILAEHGAIGMTFGAADLAHDVRLACHGLDARDNEFVIGLVGRELHPLSHIVQTMRHTRQTAEFIAQMGPFFVGRAVFRHAGGAA